MPDTYLVFGLARSGTSLVARLLHEAGIPMGERFKPDLPEWNRDGFYEDAEFEEPLLKLFRASRTRTHNGLIVETDRPDLVIALTELCQRRNQLPKWGLKSLLAANIVPEFARWVAPARLHLIWCDRPFHESCESYARRTGLPIEGVVNAHAQDLYRFGKVYAGHTGPRIRIAYHDLLLDPTGETCRLASFCGRSWHRSLATIVDPSLRRFK